MNVGLRLVLATTTAVAAVAAAAATPPNAPEVATSNTIKQVIGEVPAAFGEEIIKLLRPFLSQILVLSTSKCGWWESNAHCRDTVGEEGGEEGG